MKLISSIRYRLGMFFYGLEHEIRTALVLKPRWRWEVCLGCGPFIRCPTCGGNCGWENPRYYAKYKEPCPTCALVMSTWKASWTDGSMPCTGKFSREVIMAAKEKRHQELVAQGVFASRDDLDMIDFGTGALPDGGLDGAAEVVQNEDGSITLADKPPKGMP